MTDPEARRELARESKTIIESQAFKLSIIALRNRMIERLVTNKTLSNDEIVNTVLEMRALNSIPLQLESFVNDQKLAPKGK